MPPLAGHCRTAEAVRHSDRLRLLRLEAIVTVWLAGKDTETYLTTKHVPLLLGNGSHQQILDLILVYLEQRVRPLLSSPCWYWRRRHCPKSAVAAGHWCLRHDYRLHPLQEMGNLPLVVVASKEGRSPQLGSASGWWAGLG